MPEPEWQLEPAEVALLWDGLELGPPPSPLELRLAALEPEMRRRAAETLRAKGMATDDGPSRELVEGLQLIERPSMWVDSVWRTGSDGLPVRTLAMASEHTGVIATQPPVPEPSLSIEYVPSAGLLEAVLGSLPYAPPGQPVPEAADPQGETPPMRRGTLVVRARGENGTIAASSPLCWFDHTDTGRYLRYRPVSTPGAQDSAAGQGEAVVIPAETAHTMRRLREMIGEATTAVTGGVYREQRE